VFGFVDSMRDLVGAEGDPPAEGGAPKEVKPAPSAPALAGGTDMWAGVVQIVEGACALLADPAARERLSPELRERLASALRALAGDSH
jgi:hypothetical protein